MLIHGQARPFLDFHASHTTERTDASDLSNADDALADELQLWQILEGIDNIALKDINDWKRLLTILRTSNIRFVHQTHPLVEYASNVLFQLNNDDKHELQRVVEILSLDDGSTRKHSKLAVQKMVHDRFATQTCSFALIVTTSDFHMSPLFKYSHSCLPNAQLEIGHNDGNLHVTALYDIHNDRNNDACHHPVTICYCRLDDNWEDRDRSLSDEALLGSCCTCERCRYEMDPAIIPNSRNGTVRLARYYMGRSDWNTARSLYQKALDQDTNNDDYSNDPNCTKSDIYHALGAIAMAENQFVKAQEIWKKAFQQDDNNTEKHAGLALQASKMKAYAYFDTTWPITRTNILKEQVTWISPIPGVFLTPHVVEESKCRRIVDWVEKQGSWTQQRHYAVRTLQLKFWTRERRFCET
jgi:tetratricopeptide (TPR) repeat protein